MVNHPISREALRQGYPTQMYLCARCGVPTHMEKKPCLGCQVEELWEKFEGLEARLK